MSEKISSSEDFSEEEPFKKEEEKEESSKERKEIKVEPIVLARYLIHQELIASLRKEIFNLKKEFPTTTGFEPLALIRILDLIGDLRTLERELEFLWQKPPKEIDIEEIKAYLDEYEIPEELREPFLKFAENYLQRCRNTRKIVQDKTPEELYEKIVGEKPKGEIIQEQIGEVIIWKFCSEEDLEKYFICKYEKEERGEAKAKATNAMLTWEKINDHFIPLISLYVSFLRSKSHELFHFEYHLLIQPRETDFQEAVEEGKIKTKKDFFNFLREYWKEHFKEETLANIKGFIGEAEEGPVGEFEIIDLEPLVDFKSEDRLYDFPLNEREDWREEFIKLFGTDYGFKTNYRKVAQEYRKWARETAIAFARIMGRESIEEFWDEEEISTKPLRYAAEVADEWYNEFDQILELFILYPPKMWPRLIKRIKNLSSQWEKIYKDHILAQSILLKWKNTYERKIFARKYGAILQPGFKENQREWTAMVKEIILNFPKNIQQEYRNYFLRLAKELETREAKILNELFLEIKKFLDDETRRDTPFVKSDIVLASYSLDFFWVVWRKFLNLIPTMEDYYKLASKLTKELQQKAKQFGLEGILDKWR